MFLATTAEESGLLGASWYASHPSVPLGKTAINLNFDTISPLGEPESIVLSGSERTTISKLLGAETFVLKSKCAHIAPNCEEKKQLAAAVQEFLHLGTIRR